MNREKVNKLAAKLLDGTASLEEESVLHQWYDVHRPEWEKPVEIRSVSSWTRLGRRIRAGLKFDSSYGSSCDDNKEK